MEPTITDQRDAHKDYEIVVNGKSVRLNDPEPIGSRILAQAGFEPVDEHVLIRDVKVGSRLISLDETVQLHEGEPARFFAFRTSEVFTFTVNEHGFQWGRGFITEPELRNLAHVSSEDVLVLERGDNEPRILGASDKADLCAPGTEHLRTEKRLITVYLDNIAKEIPRGVYTTEELMTELKVPAGYLLNLATKEGLKPLKPGERIHVKEGMKFFSQVPGGGAS